MKLIQMDRYIIDIPKQIILEMKSFATNQVEKMERLL